MAETHWLAIFQPHNLQVWIIHWGHLALEMHWMAFAEWRKLGWEDNSELWWHDLQILNNFLRRSPIFNFLDGFNLNYGIIILLMTIFIKMLLFPITYKTYLSSAKMRVLKPEISEIGEKHKDDSMKKQQATMANVKSVVS